MNFTALSSIMYALFVNHTFGNLYFAFIGLFIILAYILHRMDVSADGWLVFLIMFGATAGVMLIDDMTIAVGIFVGVGILIALLVVKLARQ